MGIFPCRGRALPVSGAVFAGLGFVRPGAGRRALTASFLVPRKGDDAAMRILPIAIALLMLAGCDASPPLVQQDVRDFLQRRQDCRHWAGEEGYDAARRAEINAAYAKL